MLLDGHSANSVSKNLGIGNTNLLYRWKAELVSELGPVTETLDDEVRQLREELQRTKRERDIFAYLAMLVDLYTRKIIGWSLDLNMEEPLVIASLSQAGKARQPSPGLIHHTYRGGQYAGKKYRKIISRSAQCCKA